MILTSFPFSLWSTVWIISTPTLRISQQNVDAERIHLGDRLNAFVFSYDAAGDNGSPLLVLSMEPPNKKGNGTLQQHYWQKRFLQEHRVRPSRDMNCISCRRTFPKCIRTCILQGRYFLCWCRCLLCQRQKARWRHHPCLGNVMLQRYPHQ